MKICVYGAGAIGGYLGAKLAASGADVSLVARGAHLAAIQQNGLRLIEDEAETLVELQATDNPADLGPQDYVFITLKAHSVPSVVEAMQPLKGAGTTFVSAVNGLPWWYFYDHGGPFDGLQLQSIDPGAAQWNGIGPENVLGCVVYPATEISEPGVIRHLSGNRFSIGEPDGTRSERANALSEVLKKTGLKAPVRPKLRDEIWVKLWGNLSFNPLSALTLATLEDMCRDDDVRAVARGMMLEGQTIAEKIGVTFPITLDARIDATEAVGAHKTSMLQDLEAGRAMEIEALVGSVQELGRLTETPTPTIDVVLALIRLRAKT